jgi:N-dimethylarginine dimethylaminohydrolase
MTIKPLNSPVSIFTEFQPLEEVIVGSAYPPNAFSYSEDTELRDGLRKILEETEEDLQVLVKIIEDFGAKVRRPKNLFELGSNGKANRVDLGRFNFTFPNHALMPRDTVMILANKILQTYTRSENRFLENWAYYDLFMEYFSKGADWISAPTPPLSNDTKSYEELSEKLLLFHAANFVKCGTKIFHSQPARGEWSGTGKGTIHGLDWFRRQLSSEFNLVPAPCAGHLDGKLAILKPGLVVAWDRNHIPDIMKNWDAIIIEGKSPFPEHFKKIKKRRFYREFVQEWLKEWIGYVDETVFDVNMFSLSPELVITNGFNKECYKKLKSYGVEAIPWNFRHQFFWDGAVHCVTLDTRRRGGLENYF